MPSKEISNENESVNEQKMVQYKNTRISHSQSACAVEDKQKRIRISENTGDQVKPKDTGNEQKGEICTKTDSIEKIKKQLKNYMDIIYMLRTYKTCNKRIKGFYKRGVI